MDMVDVNGDKASPIFSFLKVSSGDPSNIKWNFTKFLMNRDGTVFKRYGSNPKKKALFFLNPLCPFVLELLSTCLSPVRIDCLLFNKII